jgi:hypothetical protein
MDILGGCFCGEIRYRAEVSPTASMLCHCRTCRRVTGAPVVGWVTFPLASFRFVRGDPDEFQSSPPVLRTFCRQCGTPLTYRHERGAETLDITTATLDEPDAFPPTHHSWLSHDLAWLKFGDGLPTYAESKPEEEPTA